MSFETKAAPRHPLATTGFTIERLPMLKVAFEQLGREIVTAIHEMSGAACSIEMEHIGIEAISDIGLSLGENGTAALLAAAGWEHPILVHGDRMLVLACLDLVFGGDGSTAAEAAFRPSTKTEKRFARSLVTRLAETVKAGLGELIEVQMNVALIEEPAELERVVSRGHAAGVAQMRLEHRETLGHITVSIPQSVLLGIRHLLTHDAATPAPSHDSAWRRKLETELQSARVSLTALLREKGFTLGDVAGFSVGQLIPLMSPIKGRVLLQSADEPMFKCDLGQADGHFSVRIESSVSRSETAIEEIASEFGEFGTAEAPGVAAEW